MAFDPVTAIFDVGNKLIDRLWPNPVERDAAKLKLVELQQTGELAHLAADTDLAKGQIEINKVEAASSNMFISGWRPAIGWTCALGLFADTIAYPVAQWVSKLIQHQPAVLTLDTSTLTTVMFAMLGMGAMRTYEKTRGIAAVEPGH